MGDKDNNAMVIFQPSGRRGEVPKGINVLEASRLLGADIEALCGEKKVCGKCKVRIEEGRFEKYGIESKMSNVSAWQEEEEKFIVPKEKETGHRLACVTEIQGDLLVFVPEESRAGKQVAAAAAGSVKRVALELGGKSANVILDDANLEEVIPKGLFACYLNSGQTCTAHTRMLVPNSRYDEAVAIAAAAGLALGALAAGLNHKTKAAAVKDHGTVTVDDLEKKS